MSKWLLIDNLTPNQPCTINLDKCDCVSWKQGTMTFEFTGGQCVELECEKEVFIRLASKLEIIEEVE